MCCEAIPPRVLKREEGTSREGAGSCRELQGAHPARIHPAILQPGIPQGGFWLRGGGEGDSDGDSGDRHWGHQVGLPTVRSKPPARLRQPPCSRGVFGSASELGGFTALRFQLLAIRVCQESNSVSGFCWTHRAQHQLLGKEKPLRGGEM